MQDHSVSYWFGNAVSSAAIITAIMGILPAAAALVGLIYYLIQIYESTTVQHWFALRRIRKLARLKAQVMMIEARGKPPLPGPGE